MRVGQARRRDAVEREIIEALRKVGADVFPISGPGAPDLLIRHRGRIVCLEIKGPSGKRTAAQVATQWPIVRSVSDALEAVGIERSPDPLTLNRDTGNNRGLTVREP